MDGDIQKRVETEPELPIQTAYLIVSSRFRMRFFCQFDCLVIGGQFYIHGPALHIAAVIQDASHGKKVFLFLIAFAVYGLIEMTGVALVGQCGVQGEIVLCVSGI